MSSFYAVRVGRQMGIYPTWEECNRQVHGFSNAQFKKFTTHEAALNFIQDHPVVPVQSTISTTCSAMSSTAKSNVMSVLRVQTTVIPSKGVKPTGRARPKRAPFSRVKRPSTSETVLANRTDNRKYAVCYTDGACVRNGRKGAVAGVGVYWGPSDGRNLSEALTGLQTNNRAEIEACCRAIEQARVASIENLEIRTDSRYVIQCINDWMGRWKRNGWLSTKGTPVKNKEDLIRLDKLCNTVNVRWTHVAGHSGNVGNDNADRLARLGAGQVINKRKGAK